eukprot:15042117-Ditylum_brightwellii.AAC.1
MLALATAHLAASNNFFVDNLVIIFMTSIASGPALSKDFDSKGLESMIEDHNSLSLSPSVISNKSSNGDAESNEQESVEKEKDEKIFLQY